MPHCPYRLSLLGAITFGSLLAAQAHGADTALELQAQEITAAAIDPGVEAHVLALERQRLLAASAQDPTERRCHQRLAGATAGAEHHQGGGCGGGAGPARYGNGHGRRGRCLDQKPRSRRRGPALGISAGTAASS